MVNASALSTFPQARRRADLGDAFFFPEGPFLVVAAQTALAVKDGVASVGILAHFHPRLDEMGAQRAFRDLQLEPVERNAIVVADQGDLLKSQTA